MRRTRRTSVAMLKQIEEMSRQGQGLRAIAKCLGISRNTVRSILRSQSEGEVLQSEPEWRTRVDWEQVKLDWGKGVTLKVLHKEWVPEISYTQFRRYFRKIKPGGIPQKKSTVFLGALVDGFVHLWAQIAKR